MPASAPANHRKGRVGTAPVRTEAAQTVPLPAVVFLISIFLPWIFQIGSLALSPYRLVLLVLVIPFAAKLYSGSIGRLYLSDLAILFFSVWCAVCFLVLHGLEEAWQPSGIFFVETVGAYALGRCLIQSEAAFRKLITLLFRCVVVLLPFALIEAVTGRNLPSEIGSYFIPTHPYAHVLPRWGLVRVQSVFEHPILYGVATGMILAPVFIMLDKGGLMRWRKSAIVFLASFLSLSSGPLSALAVQIGLLVWNQLVKSRYKWRIAFFLCASVWLAIALLSNRSVPAVLMSRFAFDESSAYARILIWNFGSQSVLNHPWFGVGLGQYDRPEWMTPSIDMFWLYNAIIFGFPGGLAMFAAFFNSVWRVAWSESADSSIETCRNAYFIMMLGFFFAGWTVHFWNGTYVLFLFLMGSGAWIAEAKDKPAGFRKRIGRSRGFRRADAQSPV